jgi:hypothetical protein
MESDFICNDDSDHCGRGQGLGQARCVSCWHRRKDGLCFISCVYGTMQ